jgi:hypothetical protein
MNGNVKASSTGGSFEKADAKASLKLEGAEIVDPGLFHKKRESRSARTSRPLSAKTPLPLRRSSFAWLKS